MRNQQSTMAQDEDKARRPGEEGYVNSLYARKMSRSSCEVGRKERPLTVIRLLPTTHCWIIVKRKKLKRWLALPRLLCEWATFVVKYSSSNHDLTGERAHDRPRDHSNTKIKRLRERSSPTKGIEICLIIWTKKSRRTSPDHWYTVAFYLSAPQRSKRQLACRI